MDSSQRQKERKVDEDKLASVITGKDYRSACQAVEAAISSASGVFYPCSLEYFEGKRHWLVSSEQEPACVVEPGTPEDLGKILKVIAATKTPFAVKSGGHTTNPGFSSTQGIQIYTKRFSQVKYDAASGTAVIGTGLTWDTVYKRLEDHGVVVLGGRVKGVGVGGFLLGGGYSYKTNQYGLGSDTIVGFNLVLPNGTVTYVTQSTDPDLFWGLKGGGNNFGIVTDFTMKTFPQTKAWGGRLTYSSTTFNQFHTALAKFSVHCQDPKAAILPSYVSREGKQSATQIFFYDDPTPPPGTFDDFTNIPFTGELKTCSYLDVILSFPTGSFVGLRGSGKMLGVTHFNETLLKAVESELTYWTAKLTQKGGVIFTYVPDPFLQSYLSHANSPSAWPDPSARQPGKAPMPLVAYFTWNNSLYDDEFVAAIKESVKRLSAVAKAEGLLVDNPKALSGNFADADTPPADIYGDNLPKLRALKAKIDPDNVMGLTGGFKF